MTTDVISGRVRASAPRAEFVNRPRHVAWSAWLALRALLDAVAPAPRGSFGFRPPRAHSTGFCRRPGRLPTFFGAARRADAGCSFGNLSNRNHRRALGKHWRHDPVLRLIVSEVECRGRIRGAWAHCREAARAAEVVRGGGRPRGAGGPARGVTARDSGPSLSACSGQKEPD